MAYKSDTPMSRSAEPIDPSHAPLDDPDANPAMLKADIDSGRTGDKENALDPGLSMLGTDDEAAGNPVSPERVNLARRQERAEGAQAGVPSGGPTRGSGKALYGFIALIVLVGVIITAALLLR